LGFWPAGEVTARPLSRRLTGLSRLVLLSMSFATRGPQSEPCTDLEDGHSIDAQQHLGCEGARNGDVPR